MKILFECAEPEGKVYGNPVLTCQYVITIIIIVGQMTKRFYFKSANDIDFLPFLINNLKKEQSEKQERENCIITILM